VNVDFVLFLSFYVNGHNSRNCVESAEVYCLFCWQLIKHKIEVLSIYSKVYNCLQTRMLYTRFILVCPLCRVPACFMNVFKLEF